MMGKYLTGDYDLVGMRNSHFIKTVVTGCFGTVLTQYNARSLNEHLNSSKWWDFGRKQGGLYVFTPTITANNGDWYRGTADAIYQNLDFLKKCHEPYVIIIILHFFYVHSYYSLRYSVHLPQQKGHSDAPFPLQLPAILQLPF